jgi:hypothetical protein
MNIASALLKPVAWLAARHANRQVNAFLEALDRPADVQRRLLGDLIAEARQTDFVREHRLESVRTLEAFRKAVPIRDYDALRPWFDRVFAGEATALLPPDDPVLMFARSSGTTGEPKHIPVTRRFLADIRRGWNVFGLRALKDHPDAWLRTILSISSSMHETTSPTGLPCGSISGLLAATQKRIVRRMYCVPPAVAEIHDPAAKYYTILRCALARDVALITTANPSSTLRIAETGIERADRLLNDLAEGTLTPPGEVPETLRRALRFAPRPDLAASLRQRASDDGALLPRHYWKVSFLANWTGGTLGLYLPRLRELFDGAPIRDIGLLASEGRFSIPLSDESPAGVAEITANVLEFLPASQRGLAEPDTCLPEDVEVGEEYFLVVTNRAGLWRYDLGDRVRVVDRVGRTPVFEFLCRGEHTANITGEKLTEHQVVEAMRHVTSADDAQDEPPLRFTLQGRFDATPYYELSVEVESDARAAWLADRLDERLAALNIEYSAKRSSQRLGPVRAIRIEPGTLARREDLAIARRKGRGEQYKHQYLLTDVRPAPGPAPGQAPREE